MDEITLLRLEAHLDAVKMELLKATKKFPPFHTGHEGYAVILEEIEELWEEIKLQPDNPWKIRQEAIQVCAMAMRLILDCADTFSAT